MIVSPVERLGHASAKAVNMTAVAQSCTSCLQHVRGGNSAGTPATKQGQHMGQAHDRRQWICLVCRHGIADASSGIQVHGAHEHTFANPQGYVFRIRCFSCAGGCQSVGRPSFEYSWFDGYAWTIELCSACGRHLGWSFCSGDTRFYGLIGDRLAQDSEP